MKKITLLLLTFTFFMAACKRNSSVTSLPDIYHYLTESQIQKTPYFTNPDFDTLTFLSNTYDTLIFAKIKTDTSYYKTYDRWCFDCPTQTNYHQTLRNTYQTLKGNGKFEVRQEKKSMYSSSFEFSFNNSKFIPSEDHIGWSGFPTFKNEVVINNKRFYDAISINTIWGDTNSNTIFINSSNGIFYFIDKKKQLNYLLSN